MINWILILAISYLVYLAIKNLKKSKCMNCSSCTNCNWSQNSNTICQKKSKKEIKK